MRIPTIPRSTLDLIAYINDDDIVNLDYPYGVHVP